MGSPGHSYVASTTVLSDDGSDYSVQIVKGIFDTKTGWPLQRMSMHEVTTKAINKKRSKNYYSTNNEQSNSDNTTEETEKWN